MVYKYSLLFFLLLNLILLEGCAATNDSKKLAPEGPCIEVVLDKIYATPAEFENELVCSSGEIIRAGAKMFAVVPFGSSEKNEIETLLILNLTRDQVVEFTQRKWSDGDIVDFSGILSYDHDCWAQKEVVRQKGFTELICAPVRFPIYVKLKSIVAG
ncbi:MAG: hypothetical protein AAGC95_17785 [Pseudomonadota bacterium]